MSDLVATASKDPSTKVGAVIVDDERIVRSMGYNGFARGVQDLEERYANRDLKYKMVVHAEINAIINGRDVRGCTLYCSTHPCGPCAAAAIQAGIECIVCRPQLNERWKEDAKVVETMLAEAGVKLIIL